MIRVTHNMVKKDSVYNLDKHQKKALEIGIDMRELFDMINMISKYDDESIAAFRELAGAMEFDLNR